jgi:hypothetical protein
MAAVPGEVHDCYQDGINVLYLCYEAHEFVFA